MKLAFWKRTEASGNGKRVRLPRPKELSDRVGIYLVTQMKEDPDWVWNLKSVTRPREEKRHLHDIRIFDPRDASVNGVEVENFSSLDGHPHLILFSGLINHDTGTVELEKNSRAAA
jgi:hypothetical protein